MDYEFFFGSQTPKKSTYTWNGKDLEGLRVALNARDFSEAVLTELEKLLKDHGAIVFVSEAKDKKTVLDEINSFYPHLTLAIQALGSQFVAFVPGCFMNGELNEERFRFRLIHALVSGKLIESIALGQDLTTSFAKEFGREPKHMAAKEFGGLACGIPAYYVANSEMPTAYLPNMASRNLFINGVFTEAVIFALTGLGGTQRTALAYFKGIEAYAQKH